MNIGIDLRPLMTAPRTGVGEYAFELLNAIFEIDRDNQYFLFYNSFSDVSANIPKWEKENIRYVASGWPNKLFNASLKIFHRPRLDKMSACQCHSTAPRRGPFGKGGNPDVASQINIPGSPIRSGMTNEYGNADVWFSPNLNFIALAKKTKFILTVHDLSFEFFPEFFTRRQRLWHKIINPKKQCQRADLILTPSENTKRDIVDYYKISPEKIKVIYPGLSPLLTKEGAGGGLPIKQKYNLPDRYILFLGAIEPRKNIIGLIEAFEKLSAPPFALVLAGPDGWQSDEIHARAKKSPMAEKIKFIGYVAPEDKPALYANAELFVYPSFYEGFGFPVLEAMACGCPVIASNRSSIPEITADAAWLIDPRRPGQIAEAMREMTTNENIKNWHIKKGKDRAALFSWDKAAREWMDAITPSPL